MSKIGNLLDSHDDVFSSLFEDTLYVHNYEEGATDDYGDPEKVEQSDSPTQTTGQVEQPTQPTEMNTASGETTVVDAEILIDGDGVLITDGDETNPYPSIIEDEAGHLYEVGNVFDEGNGRLRLMAVDSEEGE